MCTVLWHSTVALSLTILFLWGGDRLVGSNVTFPRRDSHIKRTSLLVGVFKKRNPQEVLLSPFLWAWLEIFSTQRC